MYAALLALMLSLPAVVPLLAIPFSLTKCPGAAGVTPLHPTAHTLQTLTLLGSPVTSVGSGFSGDMATTDGQVSLPPPPLLFTPHFQAFSL